MSDEIYSKLNEIHTDVKVIINEQGHMQDDIKEIKQVNDTQQNQINGLNRFQSYVKGAWAVLGGAVAWLFTKIGGGLG